MLGRRIEKLEKRYGDGKCVRLVIVYGVGRPPEGALEEYLAESRMCEGCTRKGGVCIVRWNGESFDTIFDVTKPFR